MTPAVDRWFSCPVRRPSARVQLFCLPYAGGGASVFRAWPKAFGQDVEVHAVQLPGREARFTEPPHIDPDALAAAVLARADRPYAFFGHSMGGRLAFETTRAIRRAGGTLPVHLFPSASRPPHLVVRDGLLDGVATLSDDDLTARLARAGGVPQAVLDEPELLELVLPALRTDFAWLDAYTFTPEDPLPVPLTVLTGATDPIVRAHETDTWATHTSATCTTHPIPGGHFFLHDQLPTLAPLIEAAIRTPIKATP